MSKRGYITLGEKDKERFDRLSLGYTQPGFMKELLDFYEYADGNSPVAVLRLTRLAQAAGIVPQNWDDSGKMKVFLLAMKGRG